MQKLILARRVHSELAALRKLANARRAFVHRERREAAANTLLPSHARLATTPAPKVLAMFPQN